MAEPGPVDPTEFRRAIALFATGVAVVTAREGADLAGLTANALLSVSLEPPTLLVSLSTDADTTPVAERSGRFGVSLLRADQQALSERFARPVPSAEKFTGLDVHEGEGGVPLLDGVLATFVCRLERSIPVGDHHLLLGRVVTVERLGDGLPLTFYRSRYGEGTGADTVRFPPAR